MSFIEFLLESRGMSRIIFLHTQHTLNNYDSLLSLVTCTMLQYIIFCLFLVMTDKENAKDNAMLNNNTYLYVEHYITLSLFDKTLKMIMNFV